MRWAKKGMLAVVLLGALVVGLQVYLHQFTSSPEGIVEDFFDSYNHADINGMVACMEPGTEQIVSGGVDLAGSVIGAITGIDLDLGAFVDIMPAFEDEFFDYAEEITIENVQVVSYTPAFEPELTETLVEFMPALVNVLAEDAVVSFQIAGTEESIQVEVVHYGTDGWRIPLDAELSPVD